MTTRLTRENLNNSRNSCIEGLVANQYRYAPADSPEENHSLYLDVARGLCVKGESVLTLYETTYQEPWNESSPHCQKHLDALLAEQLNLTENELAHLKGQYSQKPSYMARSPIVGRLGKGKVAGQAKQIPLLLPSCKNPRYIDGCNLFRGDDHKLHLKTTVHYECFQDSRNNVYDFVGSVTSTAILEVDTFQQHDIEIQGKEEGDAYEQALVACYRGDKNPFMALVLQPASLQKAIRYQKFSTADTSFAHYWRCKPVFYRLAEALDTPAAKNPGSLKNPMNWLRLLSPAYRQWRKDYEALGSTSLLALLQQPSQIRFGWPKRLQNLLLQFVDAESPLSEGAFIHELTELKRDIQPKPFFNVTSWYGEEKNKRRFHHTVNKILEDFCQEYEKKMSHRINSHPHYLAGFHTKIKTQLGKIEQALPTRDKNPLAQKLQNKHTRYCSIFNKLTAKEAKHKPVSPKDMKQLQALGSLSYQVKLFLEETRPVAAVNGVGKNYPTG